MEFLPDLFLPVRPVMARACKHIRTARSAALLKPRWQVDIAGSGSADLALCLVRKTL